MSKIEWTHKTWNPTTGCDKISQGCKFCYAEVMHRRLMGMFPAKYSKPFLGNVETHNDELLKPFGWDKPCMVFVDSMSDLFHDKVPDSFIDRVFVVMLLCPQHTFQILTKRPERMLKYLTYYSPSELIQRWANAYDELDLPHAMGDDLPKILYADFPLKNVWLGISCEDQKEADKRVPVLCYVPASVRFLSCEPLIGPVDLCQSFKKYQFKRYGGTVSVNSYHATFFGDRIQWVICGGESSKKARPMHPTWARKLRDQCKTADVPFFFKQWGEYAPYDIKRLNPGWQDIHKGNLHNIGIEPSKKGVAWWTDVVDGTEFKILEEDGDFLAAGTFLPEHHAPMHPVGKSKSGNFLDGVQHLNFPTHLNTATV